MLINPLRLEAEFKIEARQARQIARYATATIEAYCERSFSVSSHRERVKGNGSRFLILNEVPIISVEKITVNNAEIEKKDIEIETEKGIIILKSGVWPQVYGIAKSIAPAPTFTNLMANITVEYTAGYHEIPADIEAIALELCRMKAEGVSGIFSSESIGDWSYTMAEAGDPSSLLNPLKKYRRF